MGKNVDLVEQKLLKVVPAKSNMDMYHELILHRRYTLNARKPAVVFVLSKICESLKITLIKPMLD